MSLKRLNQAMEVLQKPHNKYKSDIQTWLSAALTFQETCKDSIQDHVASDAYTAEVYKKVNHLSELSSNALALANRITGRPTPTGRKLLEGGAFPSWVSAADRRLLQATAVKANAVVAKDGSGNFKTVAEAINAATGGRYVIYVKAGTYNENINTNKDGIMLIGDGKYSTIITGGSSVGKGASLKSSSTFSELSLSLSIYPSLLFFFFLHANNDDLYFSHVLCLFQAVENESKVVISLFQSLHRGHL